MPGRRTTSAGIAESGFRLGYSAPMPLANGEIFAKYRIIRLLGSGGMGEVYLAQHPRLPRQDALKVFSAWTSL